MSTDHALLTGQVVLVGYGRVGRRIGATLREHDIGFVVAEQNREVVDALRREGTPAVSGDASTPEVLIQAHVARAALLLVAVPDALQARKMVEIARTLNPGIAVVLRCHSDDEAELMARDRVTEVFIGEHELARGMAEHVITRFGRRPIPATGTIAAQAA